MATTAPVTQRVASRDLYMNRRSGKIYLAKAGQKIPEWKTECGVTIFHWNGKFGFETKWNMGCIYTANSIGEAVKMINLMNHAYELGYDRGCEA